MFEGTIIKDGHVHTPMCPHGTNDSFESYIERAIEKGIKEISFTEHMSLPKGVLISDLERECGLLEEEMMPYLKYVSQLQEQYKDNIKINRGFEVDYIEGKETETKRLLDLVGPWIEDSILSVHILKVKNQYYCLDIEEGFCEIEKQLGSRRAVYDLYFETVLRSIESDLGCYKPRRIGHPTLIRIFNQKYPFDYSNTILIDKIINAVKARDYEVDFNVAGLRKMFCKETYPTGYFLEQVKRVGVKMTYGSDAHSAKDI